MAGGGFFGGLATGLDTGMRRNMEQERFEAEKKTRDLQNEGLGLDLAKKREDKAADDDIKLAGQRAYAEAMPRTPTNDDEGNPMPQPGVSPEAQKFATIKAMDASMQAALKHGKRDVYKQFLDDSSSMRAHMTAEALAKYQNTGDTNALFDIYDHVFPDGGKIDRDSITVQGTEPGKRTISGKVIRGDKETPLTMSDTDLVKKFSMLSDPKAWLQQTNSLQIAQAQKQWEWQNDPDKKEGGFKDRELKIKGDEATEKGRHNKRVEELKGQEIEALKQYRLATVSARQSAASTKGDLTERDYENIVGKAGIFLRKTIESEMSKEDSKFNANGMNALLPAMQKDIGQAIRDGSDPEVALNDVYYRYKDRVSTLNDTLSGAIKSADKGWGQGSKDEKLVANVTKMMTDGDWKKDEIVRMLPALKLGKDADRVKAALGKVSTGSISGTVHAPKTSEEFAKVPKGEKYVNPADGKTYTKD